MKKTIILSMLFSGLYLAGQAPKDKKEEDINAIKAMCGCFEVEFKYTETFAPEIDYEKHHDYTAVALEWAELIEDQNNKLSIQHLLLVHDTVVIKHWRQDWTYEDNKVFHYDKDNNWKFGTLPEEQVAGQWTQKVFQVDDSPRYAGSATWIHADGKHYWENKSDSPLPRREYTKRKDYNVMFRGNRHEITDFGWLHEQDNDKVIRKDGQEDVLLAQEKGFNSYKKVSDDKCALAKTWWKENKAFWEMVRNSWDEVYGLEGNLTLTKVLDDKPLYRHFYAMDKGHAQQKDITALIRKFIMDKSEADAAGK